MKNEPASTGDDPSSAAPAAASETDPPELSTPWADDLRETFADPETQAAVDGFLREKVQPYVTKLEQDSTPNRDAQGLWEGFRDSPVETFLAVSGELFGNDLRDGIISVLRGDEGPEAQTQVAEAIEAEQEAGNELPPEVQEAVDYFQQNKAKESYDAEFKRISDDLPEGEEINRELFHPFVVAAQGDFDLAVKGYKTWAAQAAEDLGPNIPKPEDVPAPTPPPALGADQRTPQTPPTQKKYESLDEALDDFFDEQRNPPTTVGST